jgi:hypothetical protein
VIDVRIILFDVRLELVCINVDLLLELKNVKVDVFVEKKLVLVVDIGVLILAVLFGSGLFVDFSIFLH